MLMWFFISFFLLRYFVYFFDLVIFANAIFIALERNDAEVRDSRGPARVNSGKRHDPKSSDRA